MVLLFKKFVFILLIFIGSDVLGQESSDINIENHLGLSLSPEQAREMSEKGDVNAQVELGLRYRLGIGVQENQKEAERWLLIASEQNNSLAEYNLAFLYFAKRDVKTAIKWIHKAANNGFTEAQNFLGNLYVNGKAIPSDYSQAIKWFQLAANKGNINSMNSIGLMYLKGMGLEQNYQSAAAWFEKAAMLGQEASQRHLGNLYAIGHGVKQDYVRAYAWLSLAIEQNFTPAEVDKESIIKNMSPEEINAGKLLADSLRKSKSR